MKVFYNKQPGVSGEVSPGPVVGAPQGVGQQEESLSLTATFAEAPTARQETWPNRHPWS